MNVFRFAGLVCFTLAGCASGGRDYANHHPELPAAHRQILISGKVPGGEAVAGMTREQVTLAMGPASRFDNINGEDTWLYISKALPTESSIDTTNTPGSTFSHTPAATENPDTGSAEKETYTTIFFKGNRATHAQVSSQPQ